ncbi:MAG: UrcA family protein [Rhizomicrobium sp.]
MSVSSSRASIKIAMLALGACLLSLPAIAQDYGPADENIVVEAPRSHHYTPRRSAIGAPIEDVAISAPVRYDDLDLTTDRDVHRLHTRIFVAARHLCRQLDNRYPIAVSDGSPSCYRQAVDDAMAQADDAVARAYGD